LVAMPALRPAAEGAFAGAWLPSVAMPALRPAAEGAFAGAWLP
jgi:hypothetical protein